MLSHVDLHFPVTLHTKLLAVSFKIQHTKNHCCPNTFFNCHLHLSVHLHFNLKTGIVEKFRIKTGTLIEYRGSTLLKSCLTNSFATILEITKTIEKVFIKHWCPITWPGYIKMANNRINTNQIKPQSSKTNPHWNVNKAKLLQDLVSYMLPKHLHSKSQMKRTKDHVEWAAK